MKNKLFHQVDLQNYIISYLVVLIPLFIYGYYKNYISLYAKKLISKNILLQPLWILVISLLIVIVLELLYAIFKKEKIIKENIISFSLLYSFILVLLLHKKFNTLAYFIILFISLIIIKIIPNRKISLNLVALSSYSLIKIFSYLNEFSYENVYESTKNISYNLYDSFFGRTIGNFGTTNIFIIIIAYIFLSRKQLYKKEIPITSIISFSVIGILFSIFTKFTLIDLLKTLIETNFLFITIFIMTLPLYSPYTYEGNIIFGIISGILAFLFIYFVNPFEGCIIAILITSSLVKFIDYLVLKSKRKED